MDGSLLLWTRDDNQNIAISPDGVVIGKKSSDEEAIEVKCLSLTTYRGVSHESNPRRL